MKSSWQAEREEMVEAEEMSPTPEGQETSKEELQSVNEELVAANQELKRRIAALSRTNRDLQNLVASADTSATLLDRERRLGLVIDTVPAFIAHCDRACRLQFVNRAYIEWLGLTPSDVIGNQVSEVLGTSAYEAVKPHIAEVLTGRAVEFETEVELPKQGRRYIHARYAPEVDAHGAVNGFIAIVTDITDHKQAEAALRRSEAQARERAHELEALMETVPAIVFLAHDSSVQRVTGSKAAYAFLRVPPGGNLSKSASEEEAVTQFHVFKEGIELASAQLPLHRAAGGEFIEGEELEIRFDDGTVRYIYGNAVPLRNQEGDPRGAVAAFVDITDRQKAEEALREGEERFRQLANAMPQLVWTARPDGVVDYYNERREEYQGLQHTSDQTWEWAPVVHPDDREATIAAWCRAVEQEEGYEIEHRIRRSDGTYRWHLSRSMPVRNEDGRIVRWYGTATDIHKHKQAEAALREAKERFQAVAETVPDILFTTDPDIHITYLNQRWTDFTGASVEEGLGRNWERFVHPADAKHARSKWARLRKTGAYYENRQRMRTGDGGYRWVIVRARPIKDKTGEIVRWYGTVTDIDNLAQAEQDIQSLNETLEQRVEERTRQIRALTSALTAAEQQERQRIAQILHDDLQQLLYALDIAVKQLRSDTSSEREQETLDRADRILEKAIHTTRSLTVELSPPVLEGDGLETMLQWLGVHMENVYKLEVEVEAPKPVLIPSKDLRVLLFHLVRELLFNVVKHADVNRASIKTFVENQHVVIQVIDEGIGFNPVSATKTTSTDGGFGLPSLQERLYLIGGHLEIESTPGDGTRITVRAPLGAGSSSG